MSKLPSILSVTTVATTACFKVESVELQFSNGQKRQFERTVSSGRGAVVVVPFIDKDTVLLVREYGVGLERYYLSFPRGAVDQNEQPVDSAHRELMEEVGFAAKRMQPLCEFAPSPSYLTGMTYGFVADDLHEKSLPGDEPEALEVVPWKIADIDELLAHPEFIESRSIAALCYLLRKGYGAGS